VPRIFFVSVRVISWIFFWEAKSDTNTNKDSQKLGLGNRKSAMMLYFASQY